MNLLLLCGTLVTGTATPAGQFLFEDGSGTLLLEDGSNFLVLE